MSPKVYIIIINWNGERDTIECLNTLLMVDYDNMHVIISDNGSEEKSINSLKVWAKSNEFFLNSSKDVDFYENNTSVVKTVSIVENGKNLGFTGANTVGIKHALTLDTNYVLFLNNDTLVTRDFLKIMIRTAESNAEYGILGCKTYFAEKDVAMGEHKIWSLGGYEFIHGNPMNIGSKQFDRPEWKGVLENILICGCCMLIKRSVVEDVGVQSDDLFFAMDDVDYSLRAYKKGWKNVIVLDAEIYHSASQSIVGRSGLQLYYLFRNTYYFRTKYFRWYQNIDFFIYHLCRYFLIGGGGRFILGRGKDNMGMIYGISDFFRKRMGECHYPELLNKSKK